MAGGYAVFFGLLLVIIALGLELLVNRNHSSVWIVRLLGLGGLVLLGSSAPAVSSFIGVFWLMFFIAWRLCSNQNNPQDSHLYRLLLILFIVFNVLLLSGSIYRILLPRRSARNPSRVLVLGDSLTAGEHHDSIDKYWPEYLEEKADFSVEVLARPGARLTDGRRELEKWLERENNLNREQTAFVVLLGGNDLLAQKPVADFTDDLESLLDLIPSDENPAYIFELPRPPLAGRYGLVQRRLAEKYNFRLINRIHLARLMFPRGNTTDGIHLSQKGHRQLAGFVQTFFE